MEIYDLLDIIRKHANCDKCNYRSLSGIDFESMSLSPIRYLLKYTRKNLTSCNKSANKPSTRCIRTACHKLSTGLE
jgi:hypothetical protein